MAEVKQLELSALSNRPLRIGVSARIHHPKPGATGPQSRSLHFLEQSLAHWVMSHGAMGLMIPSVCDHCTGGENKIPLFDYAQVLDGLILQGGADISPLFYGESPRHPEWAGDYRHDTYQISLLRQFMAAGKPVLGICRGAQLINVALGGSLYQDIETQCEHPSIHRNAYFDKFVHGVKWESGSGLARLYPGENEGKVVSIHHQAIRELGKGLRVEARSVEDDIIEAVRLDGQPYVLGLQWHPERHPESNPLLLDCDPILAEFLAAAHLAMDQHAETDPASVY